VKEEWDAVAVALVDAARPEQMEEQLVWTEVGAAQVPAGEARAVQ